MYLFLFLFLLGLLLDLVLYFLLLLLLLLFLLLLRFLLFLFFSDVEGWRTKFFPYFLSTSFKLTVVSHISPFLNVINPPPHSPASYSDTIHVAFQHTTNPATSSEHVFCIFLSCDVTVELEALTRRYWEAFVDLFVRKAKTTKLWWWWWSRWW